MALVGLLALPGLAFSQGSICEGFGDREIIRRFGANTISNERVDDIPDLQRLFTIHRADLEKIMASKGLGHLTPELFKAIDSGNVTERKLAQGEQFEWMALRKGGVAMASGRLCLNSTTSYDGFEIKVVEKVTTPAKATCSLKVSGDCASGKIHVDATGSTAGVKVTQGSTSILSGRNTTADIDFADRFSSSPSFTATAEATGSTVTTTHTFVIPKVCLNLAYDGKPQKTEAPVVDKCTETATVQSCTAANPSCAIQVPANVRSGQAVQIGVSGDWAGDQIAVPVIASNGQQVAELKGFPATYTFPGPGTYTLNGTATNEVGETRSCTATVSVENKWTARGYLGSLSPSNDELVRTGQGQIGIDPGLDQRTAFDLSSGEVIGAGLEYHFTPVFGLMADLAFGRMDGHFMYDSNVSWLMDDDGIDYTSLSIGPTFHLTGERRVDLYVSPFVGYYDLGDANFDLGNGLTVKRELDSGGFGFGALLGVDVGLGASRLWGLHFGARFTDLDADVKNSGQTLGTVAVDPLQFEVGFRRHF